MKHSIFKLFAVLTFITVSLNIKAQSPSQRFKDGLKIYLNDDSSRYIKATALAQIWFRYNDNNPSSAIYGTPKKETFDVGLRRVRFQIMAQITKKTFFYTQLGINSFNSIATRKQGLFFHDATVEYSIAKNYLTIGGGLSGWNGTSRYSSSGVGNILCLDLPIVQEPTNDLTDQFVRKLGIFAKGKFGSIDYHFSASNPFPVQNSLSTVAVIPTTSNTAVFSTKAPEMQYQGYMMWQFLDKESNQLAYMTGSYLGKKRIFNIGGGFAYQKDAMWYKNEISDTIMSSLQQFGVDVYYDCYLNKEKQNAITAYISYLKYNLGPNYIRCVGAMNTTNGTIGNASFNGSGNSFPLIGTGQVLYAQLAYLFKKDLLKKEGTLQPYASCIFANYQKLKDPLFVYDIGLNWVMSGQNAKLSLDFQSRPIFNTDANGEVHETKNARRGQIVLQYQVAF